MTEKLEESDTSRTEKTIPNNCLEGPSLPLFKDPNNLDKDPGHALPPRLVPESGEDPYKSAYSC